MVITAKFGGSSLADAGQFRKAAEIIKSNSARRYVVASAPGRRFSGDVKVTDLLLKCYELSAENGDIAGTFAAIEERFNGIILDLKLDLSLEKEFEKIRTFVLSDAGRDYVASRGEYLNSLILAKLLGYDFIDAKSAVFFREDGTLDEERTNRVLGGILREHERAVVPGFYGSMPNGTIKTFSRGGSDISGSIVARASESDLYENWTDVSGMLMADPRCVKDPRPIEEITYQELRELSYMGATVMHEDAIFPVRKAGIPINIRNTNRPQDKGTMIVSRPRGGKCGPITGIAGSTGYSAINIEEDMMNNQIGYGRRVLSVLENHHISFEYLPSGIDTLSVVLKTSVLEPAREAIIADLYDVVSPDAVSIYDDLAIIAVVGRGMIRTEGTAARIFQALANARINIRMIDQGSCELNIIIGVEAKHYEAALNAIYRVFTEKETSV